MTFARSVLFVGAAIVSAAIIGGLSADGDLALAAAAAKDPGSFMVSVVQPATQVLWDFGYAEKMTDQDWSKVSKATTDLIAAMPTIAAGGFTAAEKARAKQGGRQDWTKRTTDLANAAKRAADQKNQMALATAGDSLVETCGGCHTEFDPNAK